MGCYSQIAFTLEVYGVNDVIGIQYGFRGFVDKDLKPIRVSDQAFPQYILETLMFIYTVSIV
jgi:hypothetical protein